MGLGIALAERGTLPAPLVRAGIRRVLRGRLAEQAARYRDRDAALEAWIAEMAAAPIALATPAANAQHYEVPAAFFERILGPHLKYSACLWPPGVETLEQAEAAMLEATCERALLRDGQAILELGCGWGSLTLWMARRFPAARIVALTSSALQRRHILSRAALLGVDNVRVVTADMNDFDPGERFDRVVSVEMFEHLRNWPAALARIRGWLRPEGRLFVHVFAHARYAYPYVDAGEDDWMARHFFTGGMMPSHDLLPRVARGWELRETWLVPGTHYARTLAAWRARLEGQRREIVALFRDVYGADAAETWYQRWRLFLLASEELFAWRRGAEWHVSQYRLVPAA